jgi:hypothetical protein
VPRNRQHIDGLLAKSRAARDPARRYVDVCIAFRLKDGPDAGKTSPPHGYVWDKLLGCPAGWYDHDTDEWIGQELAGKPHIIEIADQSFDFVTDWESTIILAEGGRRSGKTTGSLAPKLILALIAFIAKPGEVLSPTYRQSNNVKTALKKLTPAHWWIQENKSEHVLTFINGSQVKFLSADNPDSARSEGVAWGAYDERQDIGDEAAANAMLSTSEGGKDYIIFETATIKAELKDHHDALEANPKARIYPMDSYGNPFIDHQFLLDAEDLLDEDMREMEIHGRWPKLKKRIYWTFNELAHVKAYPLAGRKDITRELLSSWFDFHSSSENQPYIISVDPPNSAVAWRYYDDDTLHAVDEIISNLDDKGGIERLAKLAKERWGTGVVIFDPHETGYDKDAKKWFRQQGFRCASVKRMKQEYKYTAVRARQERDKLIVDPHCRYLKETWEKHQLLDNGKVDKVTKHKGTDIELVHIGDAAAYCVYKFFPASYNYSKNEKKAA